MTQLPLHSNVVTPPPDVATVMVEINGLLTPTYSQTSTQLLLDGLKQGKNLSDLVIEPMYRSSLLFPGSHFRFIRLGMDKQLETVFADESSVKSVAQIVDPAIVSEFQKFQQVNEVFRFENVDDHESVSQIAKWLIPTHNKNLIIVPLSSGKRFRGMLCISCNQPLKNIELNKLSPLIDFLKVGLQLSTMREEHAITERALRRTGRRMTNILQSMSEAYLSLDRSGKCTYVNAMAEKLLNKKRDELFTTTLWEALPEQVAVALKEQFTYAMQHQSQICMDFQVDKKILHIRGYPSQDGISLYIQQQPADGKDYLLQHADRLKRSLDGVVRALSFAVEVRDPYTSAHQRRVGVLAGAIAKVLGHSSEKVTQLQVAGLLHDVGKISVPSEIMTRTGALTTAEMAIIRTHPEIGYNMLRGIEFDFPVALVALQHHERLDGSGYPQGLHQSEICNEARIMGVADVVEAMASHRPYRPALGIEKALDEIMAKKSTLYDPDAVDACIQLFGYHGFDFEHLLLVEPMVCF